MLDVPPTDRPPTQAIVEKIDEMDMYINNIARTCEESVRAGLKDGYCNPIPRALFADICNSKNRRDFLQYRLVYNVLFECGDCCGPRGQDQYLEYHVSDNAIYELGEVIKSGIDCKDKHAPVSDELHTSYPGYVTSLYLVLLSKPELVQNFTKFMCGKDLDRTQPLEEFVKDWYDSTKAYIDAIPSLP